MAWILILFVTLIVLFILNERGCIDPRVIIIAVNVILSLYFAFTLFLPKRPMSNEHFIDTSAIAPVDKVLGLIGVLSTQNSNIATLGNSIIKYNKAEKYNEDLSSIAQGLCIYYSAFSHNSYPRDGKTWYNISTFFKNKKTSCSDINHEDTNAIFSQSSANFSRENGFSFGSGTIIGPKAYQLGISGNSSFSIFMTVNFSAFDMSQNEGKMMTYELLKLPANTNNNNGVSIQFLPNVTEIGGMYGTNLTVRYGTQSMAAKDPMSEKPLIVINPNITYMLVLVKNNLDITLTLYPNIENINSNSQNATRLIHDWKIDPSEDVLFSNKELMINGHYNLYGKIYNLGIYNRAIDDNTVSSIYLHTQAEIQKSNQILSNLANQIATLQDTIQDMQSCPYDEPTCTACSNVKNWINPVDLIMSGDAECHLAVDSYCKANTKDEMCACWNPKNPLSQTEECKNYVSIFNKSYKSPDASALEKIKKEHNLCDCSSSTTKQPQPVVQPSTRKHVKGGLTLDIDDKYSVNKDDLDAYNRYNIDNLYSIDV